MDINILLVEDDKFNIKLYESLLNLLEVAGVATAATITDAISILESTNIDGVISDLVLPDGCGLTIGKLCKEKGIPIVFLTGNADDYNNLLMLEYGWVLHKPAPSIAVRRAVESFNELKTAKKNTSNQLEEIS